MANRKKGDTITATVIAQYTLVVIGVLITTAFLFFIRDALLMAFKAGITILDVLTTFGLILIIGIYFVIDPETYRKGIGLFFTKKRAKRITEALDTRGNALWSWLSGQFIVMAFVGIVVTIGLMIVGVPLALLLGIIAGIILATPLAVIAMVLVGMFYVEDVLGKEITIPGREEEKID